MFLLLLLCLLDAFFCVQNEEKIKREKKEKEKEHLF
jgi:hypothetical protein